MTRFKVSDFPALRNAFSGYLHEDFVKEYGSAAAAVLAFEAEADDDEVDRFRAEVHRFLELTAKRDLTRVRAMLSKLGCRWDPPSREAIAAALNGSDTAP